MTVPEDRLIARPLLSRGLRLTAAALQPAEPQPFVEYLSFLSAFTDSLTFSFQPAPAAALPTRHSAPGCAGSGLCGSGSKTH